MSAKFIVIEGLEGAGKSNAQRVVCECLSEHAIPFITTREPGGTPIAEKRVHFGKKELMMSILPIKRKY